MEATKAKPEGKTEVSVYALINDKIIKQLSNGNVPWQKLWGAAGPPRNLITQRHYFGLNALLLGTEEYEQNLFLSFDQVHGIGGKVKRGSKGYPLVHWKKPADGRATDDNKGKLIHYTVFNVDQCENIPEQFLGDKIPFLQRDCEQILASMPKPPKIDHKELSVSYEVVEDIVHMPKKMRGKKDNDYYNMLFRQLVHSTGHDSRLARKGMVEMSENTDAYLYSKEDLIADIGACFLLSVAGISPSFKNSPAYVQGWIEKFKQDKLLIFRAAKDAQKAVNYILNVKPETEDVQQGE